MENQGTQQEPKPQEQAQQEPKPQGDGTDWKAEARKWERRAEENAEKAKAYDDSAAKARTVEERLAAIEAERDELAAAKGRADLVSRVAKATGLAEGVVSMLSATDEESMTEQAKAVLAMSTPHSSSVVRTDGDAPEKVNSSPDEMRGFVHALMGTE